MYSRSGGQGVLAASCVSPHRRGCGFNSSDCHALVRFVYLLVGCLTSQQYANVSQGRICSDNFTCCHTETEAADPTFYLTQSQYTDTGPTSPSADPITPGAWQGSHWSASFEVTGMTRPRKIPGASGIRTPDLPLSRQTPSPLGQGGSCWCCLSVLYIVFTRRPSGPSGGYCTGSWSVKDKQLTNTILVVIAHMRE